MKRGNEGNDVCNETFCEMSRRFLDRAFSQAQYREGQRQSHKRSSKQESKDSTIDDKAEPNPADLIISAYERKDYLK